MAIQTKTYDGYDVVTQSGYDNLPMNLKMQPALCEKILKDLNRAIENIRTVQEEFGEITLDSRLSLRISEFKSKLNKYALIGSDCSWEHQDSELDQVIRNVEFCYGTLMKKVAYKVSDVYYVANTLQSIREVFERRLSIYEEAIGKL